MRNRYSVLRNQENGRWLIIDWRPRNGAITAVADSVDWSDALDVANALAHFDDCSFIPTNWKLAA